MEEIKIGADRPLEPTKRAIVVGASSGVGAALVRRLAASGYRVAAVARREDKLDALRNEVSRLLPGAVVISVVHDVTDFADIPSTFADTIGRLGGLDLIAYAAAVQAPLDLDEYDFDKDQAMIETNLLGAIGWLNQAAARFEKAKSGQIVGIGSIAGDRGRVAGPVYNTSKAGLETYLEALRNRLSRHGVTVTTVKPGFVDTDLLKNAARTFWVISADEAAASIYDAIRNRRQTVYVPQRWGIVSLAIRNVPSFIFRRLSF